MSPHVIPVSLEALGWISLKKYVSRTRLKIRQTEDLYQPETLSTNSETESRQLHICSKGTVYPGRDVNAAGA